MGLFSNANLGATIIGSNVAFYAANKALGYLPEDWQSAIGGNQSKELYNEYLNLSNQGTPLILNNDRLFMEASTGDANYYSMNSTGNAILQIIGGTSDILILPFCDGYPIIKQDVIPNELPIASNLGVGTTNRRIAPTEWIFNFPIQYLRIYGENDTNKQITDARDWTQKARDTFNSYNPIGFLDIEAKDSGMQRERTIPTYAQIVNKILSFGTQFGCYLYMGFGSPKYKVTCSIEIQSPKETQAVRVKIKLTHTQDFDMSKMLVGTGMGGINSQHNQNFSLVNDNTKSIP